MATIYRAQGKISLTYEEVKKIIERLRCYQEALKHRGCPINSDDCKQLADDFYRFL
jgi:hypothetical protein